MSMLSQSPALTFPSFSGDRSLMRSSGGVICVSQMSCALTLLPKTAYTWMAPCVAKPLGESTANLILVCCFWWPLQTRVSMDKHQLYIMARSACKWKQDTLSVGQERLVLFRQWEPIILNRFLDNFSIKAIFLRNLAASTM